MSSGGAETLMEKEVWVTVTRNEDGGGGSSAHPHTPPAERALKLTLQHLQQSGGGTDLGVQLTDDADPFFLYTLQLSLEDFSRLRQSQNLKVDFAAFPSNLVQLVDKCGRRNTDQTYILELDTPASDASSCAVLSVVETNSFKNLVHLSLRLIPGTDCTVKKHLAGCLIARKIEESRLRDELAETTRDLTTRLQRATDEGVAAAAEAATLRVEVATVTTRLRNDHCTELARVQRETLEAQTAAHEERRRATQDADGAAATIVADLRRQVTELTASDTAKAAQVFELEGALRDTRARLTSSEASATANQTELDTARNEIRGLRTAAHESECTLNEARIRVAELTQEVKGKTELEAQQASLIFAATEQKTAVEVTARQLEARCAIAEKRSQRYAAEIQKGNSIITRLQQNLTAVHAKLEARSSVIVRQEQAIGGHEKERARLERELKTTQGTLDEARRGAEQTTHVSSRVEAELAETKTLLKDSQSMVSWLNKEVSKAKSSQTIEGAMQRTLTSGRAPLATKAINADSSRRVEYSRSKPEPLSDKYLVQIAPTKKVVSVERSFIPRVAPPTIPTSSENPTSIR